MIFTLLLIGIVALFASCEKNNPDPGSGEPNTIELTKKSAEIVEADRQFAFELYQEVLSLSDQENIMISPLSVSYALGMTYNGAAGTTLDAFNEVLHFSELTGQEVNESYKVLMDQLVQLDDRVAFSIANSIWYKLGYNVLEDFITTNETYFDAAVQELDFSDPGAVDIINGWIEEKTNDKIQDMLDYIPSDAVMYLINAIYFNAKWKYQFDPEDTFGGQFHLDGGGTHQADFMQIEAGFHYVSNDLFSAVEMPYGDSAFSMVVLLPNDGHTTGEIAGQMDVEAWDGWFDNAYMTNMVVELPKFTYEWKDLLNDPLTNLGLGVAFSGAADFSRITPGGGIFISRVIHQTFIDVNEEGTEAAAATIVELLETSMPQTLVFRADKPFLYAIKENSTSAIVFMGRVGKPEHD